MVHTHLNEGDRKHFKVAWHLKRLEWHRTDCCCIDVAMLHEPGGEGKSNEITIYKQPPQILLMVLPLRSSRIASLSTHRN